MVAAARSRSASSRAGAVAPRRRGGATAGHDGSAAALAVIEPPVRARPARPAGAGQDRAAAPNAKRPQLRVVPPKVRRRRAGVLAAFGCAATFSVMLALTFFQAKIAAEQMRLDAVNRQIRDEQAWHSELNLAVAQLQSPEAIIAIAKQNGLVVPSKIAGYIAPTAEQVAAVLTTGDSDPSSGDVLSSAAQPTVPTPNPTAPSTAPSTVPSNAPGATAPNVPAVSGEPAAGAAGDGSQQQAGG